MVVATALKGMMMGSGRVRPSDSPQIDSASTFWGLRHQLYLSCHLYGQRSELTAVTCLERGGYSCEAWH